MTPSMQRARAAAKRTNQPILAANVSVVVGAFNQGGNDIDPRQPPCFQAGSDVRPPGCLPVTIANWVQPSNVGVDHEQGVSWGDYRLVGTFDVDAQTFTLTQIPVPASQVPDSERPAADSKSTAGGEPVDAKTLAAWSQRVFAEWEAGHLDDVHILGMGPNSSDGTIQVAVAWAPPGTEERLSARLGIPITMYRMLKPAS